MKKILFIQRTKGCETLEEKAEALRRRAHLECIDEDPITGDKIKYYTMPALSDYHLCAEVIIRGGRVVSVRNVPEEAITRPPRDLMPVPEYGNF